MNDYKYEQRIHKRGDYCVVGTFPGAPNGINCSCGARCEPEKKFRKKQVRARLKRKLRDETEDM